MSKDTMAWELFQFLRKDVTAEALQESTDKAFGKEAEKVSGFKRVVKEEKLTEKAKAKSPVKKIVKKVKEGIVVPDPSTIDDPEGTIQTLAEEKKEQEAATDPNIKTNGAGITEEPEKSRIQKDMEKNTPDPDKLTQGKDGLDPDAKLGAPKEKEVKNITPKVSSVEEVKESEKVPDVKAKEEKKTLEVTGMKSEKAKNEGIVVADPSTIDDPEKQIQTLAEERVLTTVSDENVAKDIQSKYSGSRIVPDDVNGKKQFIIMVKETKVNELIGVRGKDETDEEWNKRKGDLDAMVHHAQRQNQKDFDQYRKEDLKDKKGVKEGVEVAVTTDDKKVDVAETPEGTVVTTVSPNSTEPAVSATPAEITPVVPEMPAEEKSVEETPAEVAEDEDTLMAEKIYVTELLKNKSSLTEKEQKFIKEVESIKMDETRKVKVNEKLASLKNKAIKK